jgi:hypothetical protein
VSAYRPFKSSRRNQNFFSLNHFRNPCNASDDRHEVMDRFRFARGPSKIDVKRGDHFLQADHSSGTKFREVRVSVFSMI